MQWLSTGHTHVVKLICFLMLFQIKKIVYWFTAGCGAHFYRCPNNRCIPHSSICDGNNDCGDTSDEQSCGVSGE